MWIQVRSMDGKTLIRIDGLSKLTKVDDLREKLVDPFDAPVSRQRLFYRGKQLENGHTLFDYNVGLNEIIQIMVRPDVPVAPSDEEKDDNKETFEEREPDEDDKLTEDVLRSQDSQLQDVNSTYKLGDVVDVRDPTMGCWFEAKIVKITLAKDEKEEPETLKEEPMDTEQNNNNNNVKLDSEKILKDGDANKLTNGTVDNQVTKDGSLSDSDKENEVCDSDKENKPTSESKLITNNNEKKVSNEKFSLGEEVDDDFMYHIVFDGYEDDDIVKVRSRHVRPRARNKVKLSDVELGSKVMVNFNYDSPTERGYWYDAIVTGKRDTRTIKELHCTVFIGADLIPMEDCKVIFCDEIFQIEQPGTQQNLNNPSSPASTPVKRQNKPECDHCQDNPRRKCKFCACHKCGDKKDPDKQLMCDECDNAFHLYCLDPPLDAIPDVEEWYCPMCKNDETEVVRAGEKLKASKKKAKMASANSSSSRDWGRGMACVGRTKMCNIVPPNHFGPIPGVEVGMSWKFRVQVSEAGVHRPHVAGIHGREDEGAYSIVLSGGYEDDKDDGEQFTYTGSGGRDLSGNKRTAEQSCDQQLTRMNRALAKNCNASIDNKKGAEASDWKAGKPVRVVRNCKGRKHSKYAPEDGNRYDGIYKIVKYWPAKGQSGFLVWRYLLKRDDPSPAPWTKAGKKRIAELGLTMQYPEGYLEQQKEKEEKKSKETPGKEKKGKRKRVIESDEEEEEKPAKKRASVYKLSGEVAKLIKEDSANEKVWKEVLAFTKEGAQQFLAKVEETFLCVCCQEIVFKPITTSCLHNICKSCLQRSFKAEVYSCPFCRNELGKDYSMASNKVLSQILLALFPGYDSGRA